MSPENKNVMVMGASGFIGTNFMAYAKNKNYKTYTVSLRKPFWLDKVIHADILVNLVGKAHDHEGSASEFEYYQANLHAVTDIFRAYLESPATLLIHFSSIAAVEEFSRDHILSEEAVCNPISAYGTSKKAAEEWLLEQELPPEKKLVILRPPMIHGKGDPGNLRALYTMFLQGNPYPLGAYRNERSFLAMENCCFLINEIIVHHDQIENGIYNIADDEFLSTIEIIQLIQSQTGINTRILNIPKPIIKSIAYLGDLTSLPLNTKRLRKMTGNLRVSNQKIKSALDIQSLPISASAGILKTLESFAKELRS